MAEDTVQDQTNKVLAKKEIQPDLLDKVTDFFSRERGLERSEKLEDAIRYYLGPYAGSLGQANQLLNPIVGLQDAGEATREGRYVDAITDTAAAALPIAGALAVKPLARGVQSGIDEAVDAVTEVMTGGTFDKGRREVLGTMVAAPIAIAAGSTGIVDELIAPLAKKTAGSGTLSASIAKLKNLEKARKIENPKGQEIFKRVRDGLYQTYYDVMDKSPELVKHEEKMKGFYKAEEEEYIKNLYPLATKENLTTLSNKELEEISDKIQMSSGETPSSTAEALESGLDIFKTLDKKLNLLKEEYIRRNYNPVRKDDFGNPITAIEELDISIFFTKYPEAEGMEDYEKFVTSGTIPSFPDVLNKMTPANSPSEPKIISFSEKQKDKKLQEFSKKLSSTIAERVSKMGELVGELKEAGIYGDYNVGAVVQGQNYKGDPKPFTVEGQSLQKVKLNNPTLKRVEERLGMKFNYIEKDGDYYIAMLNIAQKDADGITRTQAYLDAIKHKEYPVLSGPTGSVPKEFNKGGTAMKDQMEMSFGQAETVDPVSGNDVPPGSLPEEVRDDIPARLSEGEYVVPADVVRYYGVKFFEDLRTQAKMGLTQMDADGRIGGEPMEPQQAELSDDDLNSIIEQAMQQEQPMMANEGGVVGYKHGGYHPPDFLGMSVFGDTTKTDDTSANQFYDVSDYKPTAGDYGPDPEAPPTVAAPVVADPVCPTGYRYDRNQGRCVIIDGGIDDVTQKAIQNYPRVSTVGPGGSKGTGGFGGNVDWDNATAVEEFALGKFDREGTEISGGVMSPIEPFGLDAKAQNQLSGAALLTGAATNPVSLGLMAAGKAFQSFDTKKDLAGLRASRIIATAKGHNKVAAKITEKLKTYEKSSGLLKNTIGTGYNYASDVLGIDKEELEKFMSVMDNKNAKPEFKTETQAKLQEKILAKKVQTADLVEKSNDSETKKAEAKNASERAIQQAQQNPITQSRATQTFFPNYTGGGSAAGNPTTGETVTKSANELNWGDVQTLRSYDSAANRQKLAEWEASSKTTDGSHSGATKGESGCFLTTAIVEHRGEADNGPTLTKLRNFRDTYLVGYPEEVKKYYQVAPKIVAAIPKDNPTWDWVGKQIDLAIQYIDDNMLDKAHETYKSMVLELETNWLKKA